MSRRTRHRITIFSPNQKGELVELRIRQAATPAEAIGMAVAAAQRPPLGAIAYTVEIDAEGWECDMPVVLGRFGNVPDAEPLPAAGMG